MTLLAQLNLKEASWQHKFIFFHEPCSTLTRANSCQYSKSYPTRTNPRTVSRQKAQLKLAFPFGIAREKNMIPFILVFDRYNLTSSLKEARRERRQDGKPITDYHMEESTLGK